MKEEEEEDLAAGLKNRKLPISPQTEHSFANICE